MAGLEFKAVAMGSLAQRGDVPSPSTQPPLPRPCRPRCPGLGLFHPGLLRSFCGPSSSPTCTHSVSPLPWSGGSDDKASACNAGDLGLTLGQEDHLEKEMATHSSTLAWKIAWTEEPGRLPSLRELT